MSRGELPGLPALRVSTETLRAARQKLARDLRADRGPVPPVTRTFIQAPFSRLLPNGGRGPSARAEERSSDQSGDTSGAHRQACDERDAIR